MRAQSQPDDGQIRYSCKGKSIRRPVYRVSADDRQGGKEESEEAKEDRNEGKGEHRRNCPIEKSVCARATRVMKTELEVDEVELQAEPQAKCPLTGLAENRGRRGYFWVLLGPRITLTTRSTIEVPVSGRSRRDDHCRSRTEFLFSSTERSWWSIRNAIGMSMTQQFCASSTRMRVPLLADPRSASIQWSIQSDLTEGTRCSSSLISTQWIRSSISYGAVIDGTRHRLEPPTLEQDIPSLDDLH